MGKRREGREAAVQILFACDLNPGDPAQAADAFWYLRNSGQSAPPASTRAYAENLASNVLAHQADIDARIVAYTSNYKLNRISGVDRNILRLALYEMFYCDEVPPVVAINEAIEIAKRFGTPESGRFVNGILDRARKDITRPLRAPLRKTRANPEAPQSA